MGFFRTNAQLLFFFNWFLNLIQNDTTLQHIKSTIFNKREKKNNGKIKGYKN